MNIGPEIIWKNLVGSFWSLDICGIGITYPKQVIIYLRYETTDSANNSVLF